MEDTTAVVEPQSATTEDRMDAEEMKESAEKPEDQQMTSEEQTETKKPNPKLLDLAFCMDCTGSMGSYINEAQQNIKKIVEEVITTEKADIRLALIQYRDHPPQDTTFITRVLDFTSSVREMKTTLDGCSAAGGGDAPEAVADAMHDLLKLSWRDDAVKICVFISDAPPHGLSSTSDHFPNGCPLDLDPMVIANQLAAKGVTIYLVGCEPSILPYKDWFQGIAHITGGQYVPLRSARLLSKVIIGGAQEELSLQQLMEEINNDIRQEMLAAAEESVAVTDLESKVYNKLKTRGVTSKQLHYGKTSLPGATREAKIVSNYKSMAEVRANYAPSSSTLELASGARLLTSTAPKKTMHTSPGLMSRMWNAMPSLRPSKDKEKTEADDTPAYEPFVPPSAMAMPSVASPEHLEKEESYETVEDVIAYDQVSRMVQKSIATNNLKSKCKKETE